MANSIFKHDFLDGCGAVDARRHENGGGIVALSASVHDEAYIGERARVSQLAIVRKFGVVSGGLVCGGVVSGGVVSGGVVSGGVVSGGVVSGGVVSGGMVSGGVVSGGMVSGGVVRVSPIVISGGKYTLTAIDRYIKIGCKTATQDWWLKATREQMEAIEHGASKHFEAIKLAVKLVKELQKQGDDNE